MGAVLIRSYQVRVVSMGKLVDRYVVFKGES